MNILAKCTWQTHWTWLVRMRSCVGTQHTHKEREIESYICMCVCALVVKHLNYPQLSARDNQIAKNLTKTTLLKLEVKTTTQNGRQKHFHHFHNCHWNVNINLLTACSPRSPSLTMVPTQLELSRSSCFSFSLSLLRAAWRKCWWIFLICCVRSLSKHRVEGDRGR